MTTSATNKLGLALAIRFLAMAASRASAACVARVNGNHFDASNSRFVFNELPKLSKRPVGVSCALRLLNSCPLADASEFFDGNSSIRALSRVDQSFADDVIHVFLIAGLLAANLFDFAMRRTSPDLLQFLSSFGMALAVCLNLRAAVALTVAIGSNLNDAEVNAKRILNLLRRRFLNIAHGQEKVIAFVVNKVGFALSRFKQLLLPLAALIRNLLATVHRPDGDKLLFGSPGQNPIVKRERAKRLELAAAVSVELVGVGHFRNRSDYDLRRQIKSLSNVGVNQFVQVVLLERLSIPSNHADSVTGSVCFFKSSLEGLGLFFRRIQLDLRYQLHGYSIT